MSWIIGGAIVVIFTLVSTMSILKAASDADDQSLGEKQYEE